MVYNLDECIALTQNYVSTSNLSNNFRFLREKIDQITGVRDRNDSVAPESMYQLFLDNLKSAVSQEVIDEALQNSLKPLVNSEPFLLNHRK